MSHDKISAAARKRMAETGESYAAARRAVIREHQAAGEHTPPPGAKWFAISYSDTWSARITDSLDRLCSALAEASRAWKWTPTRSGCGWAHSNWTYPEVPSVLFSDPRPGSG